MCLFRVGRGGRIEGDFRFIEKCCLSDAVFLVGKFSNFVAPGRGVEVCRDQEIN